MFRSQIAQAIFNSVNKNKELYAESYGTSVEQEGGEGIMLREYPEVAEAIKEVKDMYNVDMSSQTRKQIRPEHLKDAITVIVMAEKEYVPEWLNKTPYTFWEVGNPTFVTKEIAQNRTQQIGNLITELQKKM